MKRYTVNVHYDAVVTVGDIYADDENEALEIARERASGMSLNDAEVVGDDACVTKEEDVPDIQFTPNDFVCCITKDVRDSMQLDSGQGVVFLRGKCDGLTVEASVKVQGRVRVIFRDRVYKCASRMPKELLDCYAAGDDPEKMAVSDGKEYETPYFADDTNWFELYVDIYNKSRSASGQLLLSEYWVIDAPDDNSADGWQKFLAEAIIERVKDFRNNPDNH